MLLRACLRKLWAHCERSESITFKSSPTRTTRFEDPPPHMTANPLLKGIVVGSLVAAIVTMTGTALAGTGIGAVFNLGKANSVNRSSSLSGATSGKLLQLTDKGTGAALGLTTKPGKAPLVVSSTAKVARLNADTVDGMHAGDLAQGAAGIFQSRRSVPSSTTGRVDMVAVPGFGVLSAELVGSGALKLPAFVNSQSQEMLTMSLRLNPPNIYTANLAPGESYTAGYAFEGPGSFEMFLTDSTRAVNLTVWWTIAGGNVEMFAQGIDK